MAYNAIASGSAILTTNADGLTAGLAKSAKDMDKWSRDVNGRMRDASGKFVSTGTKGLTGQIAGLNGASNGALAGLGATLGTAIGGPVGAAIGGAIGSAVTSAVSKAKDLVSGMLSTLSDTSKQGDIAEALGLTAEQFTGMAGVAKSVGEDTREFLESLVTMGKLASDAARGTTVASEAFKGLGLNANEFMKLRTDQQFMQIFDALSKLAPSVDKQRYLMNAFGDDGGKYLVPLLKKTPEQLQAMAASFAVSTEEMKKAQATTAAWGKLQTLGDKLWRSLSVAFAPGLEMLADFGTSALKAMQPVFDLISAGFDRVWRGMRSFFDGASALAARLWARIQPRVQPVFDWLERAWETVKWVAGIAWDGIVSLVVPAIEEIVTWIEAAIDVLADWATELFGFTKEWPKAEQVIVNVFRAIGVAGANAWDVIRAGAGSVAIGIAKVMEALVALGDQFNGITEGLVQFAERNGIMNESLRGLKTFGDKWKEMGRTASQRMQAWGEEQFRTFGRTAEQFNKWLDDKIISARRDNRKARIEGEFGEKKDETPSSWKLSEALEKGSKEAYSLVLKNQMRALYGPEDTAKKHLDVAKETKKVAEKSLDQQKRMADRLGKIGRT
ncbi:hypothetical protein VT84_37010 [Gemmata sp. SH-PL17]|uniref:hypothetical protein n=1 Tax=Gemmata sp. SH-PL17 TaxID=1630693 RepID=UPI00078DF5A6|nr:hypothetical protein [Gemmata sp. SH-PL17]AMV30053.1 hypothetical protein VT84_37010 [Gemmata sp. SH-PL17]